MQNKKRDLNRLDLDLRNHKNHLRDLNADLQDHEEDRNEYIREKNMIEGEKH